MKYKSLLLLTVFTATAMESVVAQQMTNSWDRTNPRAWHNRYQDHQDRIEESGVTEAELVALNNAMIVRTDVRELELTKCTIKDLPSLKNLKNLETLVIHNKAPININPNNLPEILETLALNIGYDKIYIPGVRVISADAYSVQQVEKTRYNR